MLRVSPCAVWGGWGNVFSRPNEFITAGEILDKDSGVKGAKRLCLSTRNSEEPDKPRLFPMKQRIQKPP